MNCDKLKGLLREKKKLYKDCAEVIGISETQFCKKINGEVEFWLNEIAALAPFLGLTINEFFAVFFPEILEMYFPEYKK